jgi:membrane protease YdiL (CAAX protease family)
MVALPNLTVLGVDLTPAGTIPQVAAGLAWWPVVAVLAMMLMVNVAANKALPNYYLFWALGGSIVVLSLGLLDGNTWRDLGLAPSTWLSGAVWGLAMVLLILLIFEIAIRLPRSSGMFGDQNIAALPRWKVFWRALVELPFGTVLFEEVAFRAVLWSMLCRRMDWPVATLVTALLFGLWHILPSLDLHVRNPNLTTSARPRVAQFQAIAGSVLTTAIGGLLFSALRIVSGSLFAPMGLHWATNGWGYLFARRAANRAGNGSSDDA